MATIYMILLPLYAFMQLVKYKIKHKFGEIYTNSIRCTKRVFCNP